jgi:type I restriction enzyme S subunit
VKVPKGWDVLPLGDLLTVCQYGLSEPTSADGDLPIVGMKDLGDGRVNFDNLQVMRSKGVDVDKFRLRPGDILFNRTNSADLVGKTALVVEDGNTAVFASYLVRLCVDVGRTIPAFVNAYLNSPNGQGRVKRLATRGVSQANINPTTLRNHLFVPVPPLGEQRRIAEILGAWDEAIEKVQALIQAKQKLKRGLMQQLLTPTRRFPQFTAKWRKCHIGDIADEVNATNGDGGDAPVLSCTKHHGLVLSEEYFGRRVHAEDTSGYKLVKRGQFAYATNHIEEGSIGLLADLPTGLVSPMYTVFQVHDDEVVPSLLYRILKTERYRRQFEARTNGSVNRRGGLRWTEFAKIPLSLPTREEQRHIEACFAALDAETQQLSNMNDTLTTQKRGLMQKLLTGQVRVKEAAL